MPCSCDSRSTPLPGQFVYAGQFVHDYLYVNFLLLKSMADLAIQPELKRWLLSKLEEAQYEVPIGEPEMCIFSNGVALAKLVSHLTGEKVSVKEKAGDSRRVD